MSFGGRCLKMSEMNMKVKEMKEILAAQPSNVQTIRVETLPVRIIGPNDKA